MMAQSREVLTGKVGPGRLPGPKPELKADLIGCTGSPGVIEGTARVIFSPEQFREVQPGDILVAPASTATWTPIFGLLKGAVMDSGGYLCHAAIIGREYGIPVVINTLYGTSRIKSGQRIKVDADAGAVYILG